MTARRTSTSRFSAFRSRAGLRRRFDRLSFDSRASARLGRRRHAVVLGDSHASVFAGWQPSGWRFDVLSVGGATASGIRNPNSRTEALPRFRARLRRVRPWQTIVVVLGEVDCGYVIWRRSQQLDVAVDDVLSQTLGRYEHFLVEEMPANAALLVLSAPLPTLPDDASTWGEVAQRRSDISVSQLARTDLTLRFNRLLSDLCRQRGWDFVDATHDQLDADTGVVRQDLVRHGTGDHHLPDDAYRVLIGDALNLPAQI